MELRRTHGYSSLGLIIITLVNCSIRCRRSCAEYDLAVSTNRTDITGNICAGIRGIELAGNRHRTVDVDLRVFQISRCTDRRCAVCDTVTDRVQLCSTGIEIPVIVIK